MPRKKGKATGKRRGPKPGGSKAGASDTAMLLVGQMHAYQESLAAQCGAIQVEMDAIGAALAAMGSAGSVGSARTATPAPAKGLKRQPPGRRGPRPAGGSLKDYIVQVITAAGRDISVKEITSGVTQSGYQTSSKNLGNQVSMALIQLAKSRKAKKVGRGLYRR